MKRQPTKIVFDPPITSGPAGGSVKVQIKDDGTLDWALVVRYYGGLT